MKAFTLVVLFAVAALLAGTSTAVVRAQGAPQQATPDPAASTMDPHKYIDPGLEFTAPAEAYLVGRRVVPAAALGEDLAPVAVWAIYPGKPEVRLLKIEMESFTNNPAQWEGQFESQMHGAQDGVLFKKRTPISLTNGMPASFVEITYGSGFESKKEYAVVYARRVARRRDFNNRPRRRSQRARSPEVAARCESRSLSDRSGSAAEPVGSSRRSTPKPASPRSRDAGRR